uniref:Uncharacterized protein n=1 Tax=Solanum lycopersicum TaxID=4081 RepID=A0A3Q7G992_SOLLC
MEKLLKLPVLLLLLLLQQQQAVSHSTVEYLPGLPGRLPFPLETGYIGVGKDEELQLFYYFLESESEPTTDPLLIWLPGGPGCSAVTAIVNGIGNTAGEEPFVNLQGYLMGSPGTFRPQEDNYQVLFSYGMGLISNELYKSDWRKHMKYWANDPKVQEALHIQKGSIGSWVQCNKISSVGSPPNYTLMIDNVVPYHANLSIKGYRSLIYSGDHDYSVPFQSTQKWIKSLNYSIVDDWRPWNVNNQVAGYTRSYSNKMTFATVKGSGHTACRYKPEECFVMFKRWINYDPL